MARPEVDQEASEIGNDSHSASEMSNDSHSPFLLAFGTYEGGVLSYKVDSENIDEHYGGELHKGAVRCIRWTGQKKLISGGSDEMARVSDCRASVVSSYFAGDRGCVSAYAGTYGTKAKKNSETSLTTIGVDGSVLIYHKDCLDPVYRTSFAQRNENTGKPKEGDLARAVQNPEIESLYAVLYLDGSVWLWNIEKKRELAKIYKVKGNEKTYLRAIEVCWSADGQHVIILGKSFCKVVRISDGLEKVIDSPAKVFFTCVTCFEDVICLGSSDGQLRLYRLIAAADAEASDKEEEDGERGGEGEGGEGEGERGVSGTTRSSDLDRKRARLEKVDEFLLEPWLELRVPSSETAGEKTVGEKTGGDSLTAQRVKLVKSVVMRDADSSSGRDGLRVGIVACIGSGRVDLFEICDSSEVDHSQLVNCPYTITCMDVVLQS